MIQFFFFVEVTIDPLNSTFIVPDRILFETNGNSQWVDLVAFGQKAIFHKADPNSPDFPFFIINPLGNETWDSTLPHVIYGYGIVDSLTSLTINPGTLVCFHPGAALIVYNSASLHVEGTPTDNVIIQGDKLQYSYTDMAGQWDRIWLMAGSKNSTIRNAVIKNGNIGLQVDTFATANDSTLYMENVIVKNMSTHALLLRGSKVSGYNCVFANCGSNVANILYGGYYKFYHCTFANFWFNSTRQDPVLLMNNYYNNGPRGLTADFGNSIVYGNNEQELGLDSFPINGYYNFHFDHSLLKIEPSFNTTTPLHYSNIVRANGSANNPKFVDVSIGNYLLDTLSAGFNVGDPAILNIFPSVLNNDLLGNSRLVNTPDLGAYERQQ
ncbi:MAG: hypothetical protein IPP51_11155 [Bacteroidetes bacterium]|nr:hypothetical protein [Bacteroidota bacterium]